MSQTDPLTQPSRSFMIFHHRTQRIFRWACAISKFLPASLFAPHSSSSHQRYNTQRSLLISTSSCAHLPQTRAMYPELSGEFSFKEKSKQARENMAAEQEEEVEKRSLDEKSVRLYNITSWKMLCIDCRVWCDASHPKLSSSYPSIRLQSELYVCCYILESLVSNGYIRVVDMSATLGIGLDTEIFYCSHCRLSSSSAILAYSSRSIF